MIIALDHGWFLDTDEPKMPALRAPRVSSGSFEKRAPVCEVSAQEHNTVLARAQKPRPLDPKTSSLTTELPTKKK